MKQNTYVDILIDQIKRALWEVRNVIDCILEELWKKEYCQMPCWKHIYHMLHSLDLWLINPQDENYQEPDIHEKDLNNLDVISKKVLSREEIIEYFNRIEQKINDYLLTITDEQLLKYPDGSEYTRFTLIIGQMRHLHSHMGILMGFIIDDTGMWPRVLGLQHPFPKGEYDKYF